MKKRISVLIVDDSADVRDLVASMLGSAGCITKTAASAPEALAVLMREENFDLIVSDFQMPGGSGVELFHAIRKAEFTIPFVLMSGHVNLNPEELLAMGISEFIQKPFRRDQLENSVARIVAKSREALTAAS